jgi:hypothetical protein
MLAELRNEIRNATRILRGTYLNIGH